MYLKGEKVVLQATYKATDLTDPAAVDGNDNFISPICECQDNSIVLLLDVGLQVIQNEVLKLIQ